MCLLQKSAFLLGVLSLCGIPPRNRRGAILWSRFYFTDLRVYMMPRGECVVTLFKSFK
jgi:hypothetical protein